MKIKILIALIFLFSCDEAKLNSSLISNNFIPNIDYTMDLDWDNSQSRSITQVHIKWKQWEENDSTSFESYFIKDVSTEEDKLLDDIVNIADTTYSIDFPAGTFLKICVLANYNIDNSNSFISSDTIQFFTQPMSPTSNIVIDTQPFEHIISWAPSSEENITNLILYRTYIQENDPYPNLTINPSNGLPNDSQWEWSILYEGDNYDSSYVDSGSIVSDYKYFYTIRVQIQDLENIENYRYSLIIPSIDNMINTIIPHTFNLNSSTNLKNYILLEWEPYLQDDFYSYELWRTDILTSSLEELENNGEKLAEITDKDLNYFEDRNSIGAGKKWYYFIKVSNNYGDEIKSEIAQGDTRL